MFVQSSKLVKALITLNNGNPGNLGRHLKPWLIIASARQILVL